MTPRLWHNYSKTKEEIMPKNKIQFQKGLSLPDFIAKYGTEQQCQEHLFRLRWPSGFVCPRCHSKQYSKLSTRPLYQCKKCKYQSSLISNTIFASTKLPLTVWFLAIYYLTQSKKGISSLNLSRILGISANASLRLKHKLQQVMKNEDDAHPLTGNIQIDDAYWGGKKHDGVRGRGATGKTPFIAAVSTNNAGHPIHMRLSRLSSFSSEEIRSWALNHLHNCQTVLSDGLRGFTGIKKAGFNHISITTGGGYQSTQIEAFTWINTILGNVKRFLHGTYHAISSKHLPRYLAEFCYRFNRRFHLEYMPAALIRAAVNSKPIPQHKLQRAEDWW